MKCKYAKQWVTLLGKEKAFCGVLNVLRTCTLLFLTGLLV